MTAGIDSEQQWVTQVKNFGRDNANSDDQVSDTDVDIAGLMSDDVDGADQPQAGPVDLDDAAADDPTSRFDHKVAWRFAGLAAAGVVVTLATAVAFYWPGSKPLPRPGVSLSEPQKVAVAKPTTATSAATAGVDRPLPYTADAQGSCAPGSTPAQTMSGNDSRNAFKCVRAGGDGQTILIDLGRTYVITAISITPGWVGKDASGVSQWSQHRVVTLVQYAFDNDPSSLVTQDTRNVHGEAVQPVKHQLACRIQMLIRQTSRPPAEAPQPSPAAPAPGGGGLTSILGEAAPSVAPAAPGLTLDPLTGQAGNSNSDPVDASFAISNLKIIGHEAV